MNTATPDPSRPFRRLRACLLALASAVVDLAGEAAAETRRVGIGAGCDTAFIQTAINGLPPTGAHEIQITNDIYLEQAITINGRAVTLRGGYANCGNAAANTRATLSGAGGSSNSVLTIGGSGNNIVLENLNLTRGDEASSSNGGGIDFRGSGRLTLRNVGVVQNYAGYGGGISFAGQGGNAELRLEAGTVIAYNTAQYSGGGVRMEGTATMRMNDPDVTILGNEALGINPANNTPLYGTGGGVMVIGPAKAYISSPSGTTGAIVGNRARYGGGIGVVGGDGAAFDDAYVHLYSTDPARPVRVYDNRASNTGGGIFLDSQLPATGGFGHGVLCAWDVRIDGNIAQEGSAIYADSDFGAILETGSHAFINTDYIGNPLRCTRPDGSVRCAAGVPCNTIEGNRAETSAGTATAGAAILIQNEGDFHAKQLGIRNNVGSHAIRAFLASVKLDTVAIAGNTVSGPLLRLEDDTDLEIFDSTLAANTIAANHVMSLDGTLSMFRSLIWQPGKSSLTQSGGSRNVNHVIASEAASLGAGTGATVVADARLVDPERGDVRLRAASPAIDYVTSATGYMLDVDGLPRNWRLSPVPRAANLVRDIGAHERQTLAPLMYNTDFDVDGRFWTSVTPGVSTWDGTQNASGPAGSGSIKLFDDDVAFGQRVTGIHQCIHLPGPGTYALNGYGRSGPGSAATRDYVYLGWAFRRTGSESCNSGPATTSGNHFLSDSSGWSRPANPTLITVSAADWTSTSSIDITQVVVENGITSPANATGWFDGITLEYIDPTSDTLFRNSFDP